MSSIRKPSKRADPLRAKASGVGESRRAQTPQRDSRSLPSWYFRVLSLCYKGDREVEPWEFDEDLSELEDDKEQESGGVKQRREEEVGEVGGAEAEEYCECGREDDECSCYFESDSGGDESEESERSYNGSDADCYYELKGEREERKREKLRERKQKERARDMETAKEEEVRAAYRSFKKARKEGETTPIDSLAGQEFKLFCSDHVDHFYSDDIYPTKRVQFYHPHHDHNPNFDRAKLGKETGMLHGLVYLDGSASCGFGPFRAPRRASRKAVKVKSDEGPYEVSLKFLGNGYLKLRVSREMVFMGRRGASTSGSAPSLVAPKVFEFFGIWRDTDKEKAERQEMMPKTRSPRETWFEMNHPMGAWNELRTR